MRIISIRNEIHMKKFEEIENPINPIDIIEDFPDNFETIYKTAKLSKDSRNQFFVRFPREVSEALGLDNVKEIGFDVKVSLPDAKSENASLNIKLIREGE